VVREELNPESDSDVLANFAPNATRSARMLELTRMEADGARANSRVWSQRSHRCKGRAAQCSTMPRNPYQPQRIVRVQAALRGRKTDRPDAP